MLIEQLSVAKSKKHQKKQLVAEGIKHGVLARLDAMAHRISKRNEVVEKAKVKLVLTPKVAELCLVFDAYAQA